jgi:hypothetical protein
MLLVSFGTNHGPAERPHLPAWVADTAHQRR